MTENEQEIKDNEEITAPGYKSVFYTVFAGSWIYLGFLFYKYL